MIALQLVKKSNPVPGSKIQLSTLSLSLTYLFPNPFLFLWHWEHVGMKTKHTGLLSNDDMVAEGGHSQEGCFRGTQSISTLEPQSGLLKWINR